MTTNKLSACFLMAGTFIMVACASYETKPYPWNMAPAEEWNAPLEMSWVNACDNVRSWLAPKGKVWNPVLQNYEPDFSEELYLLREKENLDKR